MKLDLKLGLTTALCASMLAVISCSKDEGKGGGTPAKQSILGKANEVGYFPDGEKAQELSEDQLNKVSSTVKNSGQVATAVAESMKSTKMTSNDQESALKSLASLKINEETKSQIFAKIVEATTSLSGEEKTNDEKSSASPSSYKDELKTSILENCKIVEPKVETKATEQQRAGNSFRAEMTATGAGEISGEKCPVSSKTSINGSGTVAGTIDSQDQVENASITAKGSLKYSLEADDSVTKETGFRSTTLLADLNSMINTSKGGLSSISLELNAKASVDTVEMPDTQGEVLTELNVATAGGEGTTTGEGKFVLMVKSNDIKLLLQVFVKMKSGNEAETKIYLNGKEISQQDLVKN